MKERICQRLKWLWAEIETLIQAMRDERYTGRR